MKILLIQLGSPSECLLSTSLIPVISKNNDIDVIVADKNSLSIFNYNPNIRNVYIINKLPGFLEHESYDKMINLHPSFSDSVCNFIAKDKIGFNYSEDSHKYYTYLYGQSFTKQNVFQIYFNLAGEKWKGQGFDFHYFPKNKTKKNRTGLAVANRNLREYIIDRMQLTESHLWHIPFKKNIYRRIDEINRCKNIITDDFFSMNISLAYRKHVYFLKTVDYNFQLEMFGKGVVFEVPKNIVY